MSKVIIYASISVDGYMTGPGVSDDQPMGRGGERLHDWMFGPDVSALDQAMAASWGAAAGAVVLGRRTFDVGLRHWEDTPYPVPSFVVTHRLREPLPQKSADFTFVAHLDEAVEQAKAAADGRDVIVMGAEVARQALAAGLVDELRFQIVPILLGAGARPFDGAASLERIETADSPAVTHLTYRVLRS